MAHVNMHVTPPLLIIMICTILIFCNRYALISKCWRRDADDRPCFKAIVEEIGEAAGK